jgi:tRNA pseudouridine32 synthase/23S rRNA pseudouridine746 synthase
MILPTKELSQPALIFSPLDESAFACDVPDVFSIATDNEPHPLCLLAVSQLQAHLEEQEEWEHNFGLSAGAAGAVIGKMFGVLVVRTKARELGYLAAFSGKLAGGNHHAKFVPPVFDGLVEGGFVNEGMTELTRINAEISALEESEPANYLDKLHALRELRKTHSVGLQRRIFEQYHFLNRAGRSKSLINIFEDADYKNPPAGAGECAAPKLLQYAFTHEMQPLALAEFWWGQSPKSATWKHGQFYAPCKEKCAPILAHMLEN